jgi:thiamine biosynthesis lipoprotein
MQMMRKITAEANRHNKDSTVTKINQQAGIKAVKVNHEILTIIKNAKKYGKLTEGKFDITIAPVIELWGFGTEKKSVPDLKRIEENLKLVDYQNIIINEEKSTVMLAKQGMKIDLGGIAKGYIVDRAAEDLKKAGINSALINVGGNIRTIGVKADGQKWRLGIRNPRDKEEDPDDNYLDVIKVEDANVVTSGDYERYFKEEGQRYHHILDPDTGYPSRDLASVTIVSDSSFKADILSTALFILGFKKAKSYIQKNKDLEGMIITTELKKWKSSGFEDLIVE